MVTQTSSSGDYVNGVKRIFDWDDFRITLHFGQRWGMSDESSKQQMWIDVKPITSKPPSPYGEPYGGLSRLKLSNMTVNDHIVVFAYSTAHLKNGLWDWLRKSEVQDRIRAEMEAGRKEYDASARLKVDGDPAVPPLSDTVNDNRGSSIEAAGSENASDAMGSNWSGGTGKTDIASNGFISQFSVQTHQGPRKRSASVGSNASSNSTEAFVSAAGEIIQN